MHIIIDDPNWAMYWLGVITPFVALTIYSLIFGIINAQNDDKGKKGS